MPSAGPSRRAVAAGLLAAAIALVALLPTTASARKVSGAGFVTESPGGWKVTRPAAKNGWHAHLLASPAARSGSYAEATRIAISWIPANRLKRRLKRPIPRDPAKLVKLLQAIPKVKYKSVLAAPTPMSLAGEPAAYMAVNYVFRQNSLIQKDVAIARHNRVYLINMVGGYDVVSVSMAALTSVVDNWRWR